VLVCTFRRCVSFHIAFINAQAAHGQLNTKL
jgi:hypothetical protein